VAAQSLRRDPDRAAHIVSDVSELRRDLVAEQDSLDAATGDLNAEQWSRFTASPGWSVFDQIAHLAYFDERASIAVSDPERFRRELDEMLSRTENESLDDITLGTLRSLPSKDLLTRWRENRQRLNEAAASLTDESRIAWYGPSMGAKSFLTARLMETWAHGVDVVEALGVTREPTDRLRHIAQLGFITRQWSYSVRGEVVPSGAVRLELKGPRGDTWRWGPGDAEDSIEGPAEDFCLVVTQRRHPSDTNLSASELGAHWLQRAQAFAGSPSEGPRPGSRQ
jgi:uncharacterized protein (TIGR03084 family)